MILVMSYLTGIIASDILDPGGNLGNLPANPTMAWSVIATVIVVAIAPILVAKISAKKNSNAPTSNTTSIVLGESITPRIDASQTLLEKLVSNLERRVDQTEAKYAELEQKHYELQRKYARAEAEVDSLREEIQMLRGRLMGSG